MSARARSVLAAITRGEERLAEYTDVERASLLGEDYPTRAVRVIMSEFVGLGDGELIYADGGYGPTHSPDVDEIVNLEPDEYDRQDDISAADKLAAYVTDEIPVYVEPDCLPGLPSWWSGRNDSESGEEWSVHLLGPWTDDERAHAARSINPHFYTRS